MNNSYDATADSSNTDHGNSPTYNTQGSALSGAQFRHAQYYLQLLRTIVELYRAGGRDQLMGLELLDHELEQIDRSWQWAQNETPALDCLEVDFAVSAITVGDLRYPMRGELLPRLSKALEAARRLGNKDAEGNILSEMGSIYYALGEQAQSIELHTQHLMLSQNTKNLVGASTAFTNLGLCYHALGEMDQAIRYQEQSIEAAKECGDLRSEATALGNIGICFDTQGDGKRAIHTYEQQLVIARQLGRRRNEGIALGNLGNAYVNLGDFDSAITCHEHALNISRALGDRWSEGQDLGNLGRIYCHLGDYARAIEYLEARLALAYSLGDRKGEGKALDNFALIYSSLEQCERSLQYFNAALELNIMFGDKHSEGVTLNNMAVYISTGLLSKSAEPLFESIGSGSSSQFPIQRGRALSNIGNAYSELGDSSRAIENYEQNISLGQAIGDYFTYDTILFRLRQ